jgi:hypothetical protein
LELAVRLVGADGFNKLFKAIGLNVCAQFIREDPEVAIATMQMHSSILRPYGIKMPITMDIIKAPA